MMKRKMQCSKCAELDTVNTENRKLRIENEKLKRETYLLEKVRRVLQRNPGEDIVDWSYDKNSNNVLLTVVKFLKYFEASNEIHMTFNACSIDTVRVNNVAHIHLRLLRNIDNRFSVYIEDLVGDEEQGYGSIILSSALKYLNQYPLKEIRGRLSPVDIGRGEEYEKMLHHFYQKHGFTINHDKTIEIIYDN